MLLLVVIPQLQLVSMDNCCFESFTDHAPGSMLEEYEQNNFIEGGSNGTSPAESLTGSLASCFPTVVVCWVCTDGLIELYITCCSCSCSCSTKTTFCGKNMLSNAHLTCSSSSTRCSSSSSHGRTLSCTMYQKPTPYGICFRMVV